MEFDYYNVMTSSEFKIPGGYLKYLKARGVKNIKRLFTIIEQTVDDFNHYVVMVAREFTDDFEMICLYDDNVITIKKIGGINE